MILNELFSRVGGVTVTEGGNLAAGGAGWTGVPGEHAAQDIELKIHNRTYMVGVLDKLLNGINNAYAAQFKEPLWSPELMKKKTFLSGSSLHFFNVKGIPDEQFIAKKPKVGDIDTQCNVENEQNVQQFLTSIVNKQVGGATFLGFKPGNNQFSGMFELHEPPVKVQIDFEFGRYDPVTKEPDEWYAYSHSSDWADVEAGIKGVFHKYLNRALTTVSSTEKYVARVLKKSVKISDQPVDDNNLSFAVSGGQGGGMSTKYKPYIDPATGAPMEKDGIPVMQLLKPEDRDYIQNLDQQFTMIYGRKPSGQEKQLMNSFVGTLQLANKYLDDQSRDKVANSFVSLCFEPGTQMLNRDDPARDREQKFAAIDNMLEKMKLSNAAGIRKRAVEMSKQYEDAYKSNRGLNESINEEEVKAQLRKGMPHLRALKPVDLLDLIDEIHDGNGRFKLQNIPLNVKVDGFGGRFGKSADGKPFMGTSNTPPKFEAGFVKYHQAKGTTDPEILGRAQMFDNLFNEMMNAIKLVDSKLGPDFLINKQVTCEVLFLPFATETPEGKLKFVGIHYDKLPEGVQLALVPFRVVDATSGDDIPDAQEVVKELTSLGQQGSVMFINNSLTQNEALDVTAIVPPVENIEQLKAMLASGKLVQKREAKSILEPIAIALEQAIINDPNIVGKDMLGSDYEGIVLNTRLGPVKVTSQEQRKVIADKQAAKAAARVEQPKTGNKTAVVAIGSFVGHIGHEQLWDYTVKKAAEVGGDPYLFMGNAVGKDDPIPVEDKLQTWHKLYPNYAKNISATQTGGSLMQKIKHELINPLPGKPPRYDNVIIMVGEDQANMPIAGALMKAVNKFPGYEHVKVSLEVTPRGTKMSFTKLRDILKNPNATPEQQFELWAKAFDVNKLGADWIKHLMDVTKKGMGIQMQQPQQPAAPKVFERTLNALIKPKVLAELGEVPQQPAKKSWADYGMNDKPVQKPEPGKIYQGWQDYEKAKSQQPAKPMGEESGETLDAVMAKINSMNDQEFGPVYFQSNEWKGTHRLGYDLTFRRMSATEAFKHYKGVIDRANRVLQDYQQQLEALGVQTKIHLSTLQGAMNSDRSSDENGDSDDGYSEYEQSLGGELTFQLPEQGVAEGEYDGANLYSPEANQIGSHFIKEFGLTDYIDQQLAIEIVDNCLEGGLTDPKQIRKQVIKYLKQSGTVIQKQGVAEARQSNAAKLQKAFQREQEKTAAERKRGEELLNPKKAEPKNECAGVGVIANKKQAKDPRYSMSLTKDVKPGQVQKNLKAFNLAETMIPASSFAGSKKNKLGPAGQLKATAKHAKAGDLVGSAESIETEGKKKGADGKACWKNYRYNGTENGKDKCVPVSESVETTMAKLIRLLENK